MKANILIFTFLFLATSLAIFGQDISYLMDKNLIRLNPIYYLTAITSLSIFLYLITTVFTYIINKRNSNLYVYFFVVLGFSLFVSLWSLFILAMWWG